MLHCDAFELTRRRQARGKLQNLEVKANGQDQPRIRDKKFKNIFEKAELVTYLQKRLACQKNLHKMLLSVP